MFTELKGSSRNQVVNVKPVSCGHLERGGTMMAEPAFPGKLKKTSGPDLKMNFSTEDNCLLQFLASQNLIQGRARQQPLDAGIVNIGRRRRLPPFYAQFSNTFNTHQ